MPIGYWLEDQYSFATPLEALEERLKVLVQREEGVVSKGTTCSLKDRGEMTCSCCPVHEVGQDTPLSFLCRLGREQERITAMIITKNLTLAGEIE